MRPHLLATVLTPVDSVNVRCVLIGPEITEIALDEAPSSHHNHLHTTSYSINTSLSQYLIRLPHSQDICLSDPPELIPPLPMPYPNKRSLT